MLRAYLYTPIATLSLLLRVPILRAYCYTFRYEPTATRLSLCAYCYAPIALHIYHYVPIATGLHITLSISLLRLWLCAYRYAPRSLRVYRYSSIATCLALHAYIATQERYRYAPIFTCLLLRVYCCAYHYHYMPVATRPALDA